LFIVWYFFFQIACIFLLYSTEKCFTPKHNYFRTREHFFELWTIILNCPNIAWIVIFSNSVDIFPLFEFFFFWFGNNVCEPYAICLDRQRFPKLCKHIFACANICSNLWTIILNCQNIFWTCNIFRTLWTFLFLY
jgi:hypothetical protein